MRIDYSRTVGPCWRCKKPWKHDTRNPNEVCPDCRAELAAKAADRGRRQ